MSDQVKTLAQTPYTGTAATVVQRMTGGERNSPPVAETRKLSATMCVALSAKGKKGGDAKFGKAFDPQT